MEPTSPQIVERKEVVGGMMLQTVPRVPMAGVKRRWCGRIVGLQESSPEVTSSGVLSPPPHFHPSTPEGAVRHDDLQLWDLDLHRGMQNQSDEHLPAASTLLSVDPTSPTPTIEGTEAFSLIVILTFALQVAREILPLRSSIQRPTLHQIQPIDSV